MGTTTGRYDVRAAAWATRMVFAANGALFATWVSRIPAVRDDIHADPRGLGFALLCAAVGSLAAMPLSARAIRAVGDRAVIGGCVVVSLVAYPALGLVRGLVGLGAVLLFVGAAVGVWDVAMNVAGHAVETDAGRPLMPGFHAAWSLGGVTGAGAGALAASAGLTPLAHFVLAAGVIAVVVALSLRRLPDSREAASAAAPEVERVGALVRDPRVLALGLMTFCAAWAEGAANDWLALLLADDRHASQALAAAGFTVFATAMTLGRLAGNRAVATLGRVRTLRWGATVATVGVVALLAVPSMAVAYGGALLWGLGIATAFPLAMSAAGETPGRGPGAIAVVTTIAYSGFLIGPPLIGSLAHGVGLGGALWVVVLLTGGVLVLAGTARPVRVRSDVPG